VAQAGCNLPVTRDSTIAGIMGNEASLDTGEGD
jgi:hypothetical protein